MPGFKDGPVPSPNYEDNNNNQFSEVTEFTNDVYVYGKLYADIDILEQDTISFNNVNIDKKKSGEYLIFGARHMMKKEQYNISLTCVKLANLEENL